MSFGKPASVLAINPAGGGYIWRNGQPLSYAIAAAGDLDLDVKLGAGTLAGGYAATLRGVQSGGELYAVGQSDVASPPAPQEGQRKRVTILQETGAAGLSALTNLDLNLVLWQIDGIQGGRVVAGAAVTFDDDVPVFVTDGAGRPCQRGFEGVPFDNGIGDVILTTPADRGLAPLQTSMLAARRGVLSDSELSSLGAFDEPAGPSLNNNRDKRFTILQEGAAGADSTLLDLPFDCVVVQGDNAPQQAFGGPFVDGSPGQPFSLAAVAFVDFPGGVPTLLTERGGVVAVNELGDGDTQVVLGPDRGQDPARRLCIPVPLEDLAADGLVALACDDTSAFNLRITSVRANGAGGSIRSDVPFLLLVFRIVSP